MCFDCDPMQLVGKIVRGSGKYEFKDVPNSENDFYIVEGVTYKDYGKTYNFTLRKVDSYYDYEYVVRSCRRGTFYNHFQYTREVPESVYNRVKKNIESHQNLVNKAKKVLKNIKKPKVAS
jgi:hypothetical protein